MIGGFLSHVVVRNALLLYVIQFSSYLLPLITLPYLSRVLSPERLGLVAYAQSFVWYFIILTEYGFPLTATREIAVHRENRQQINDIFSAVMVARFLLTCVGFLILLVSVFAISRFRQNMDLFLLAFLSVVGYMLFPGWLFQGLQRMGPVAVRDFLAKLLSTVAVFLVVHSDSDYLAAAAVQSGGIVLAGLIGLLSVRWTLGVRFTWPPWERVWGALKAGWPVFVSTAASTLTAPTNVVILGFRAPAAEVAYFTNAHRLIAPLRGLVGPVVTAVYPHVSQKAARSEEEALRFVRKYRWLFAAPFLVGGVLLVVLAPWLVRVLMGPKYVDSTLLIQIMAFSPFWLALSHTYSTYYMLACGYDKEWMRIILTTVVANFLVLVPLLIFMRASLAVVITMTAIDIFSVLAYHRFYRKQSGAAGPGRSVDPSFDPDLDPRTSRDAPIQ